ncbi:MAG: hypothetical protein NZ653_09690 [Anaerolineae bacterium]|nr:hypothetical protein [Anaerolineae bacterium]
MVTTHLIAPVSWFHHMALAFVALLVAWQFASGWERVFILLAYALMNLQGLFWHQLVGYTLLLSLGTYGLLILWGVLAWQIVKRGRQLHRRGENEKAAHPRGYAASKPKQARYRFT